MICVMAKHIITHPLFVLVVASLVFGAVSDGFYSIGNEIA